MNNTEFTYGLLKLILHWFGLFGWAYLSLLLMEVVVCKDARMMNIQRLLELSFKRRSKIFLRNLKSPYYFASVMILLASFFALCQLSLELWTTASLTKSIRWSIFHPVLSQGLIILYRSFGYRITYISKIKEFLETKK